MKVDLTDTYYGLWLANPYQYTIGKTEFRPPIARSNRTYQLNKRYKLDTYWRGIYQCARGYHFFVTGSQFTDFWSRNALHNRVLCVVKYNPGDVVYHGTQKSVAQARKIVGYVSGNDLLDRLSAIDHTYDNVEVLLEIVASGMWANDKAKQAFLKAIEYNGEVLSK